MVVVRSAATWIYVIFIVPVWVETRRTPKSFIKQAAMLGAGVGLLASSDLDLGSMNWAEISEVIKEV